jgi:hypothetical protein
MPFRKVHLPGHGNLWLSNDPAPITGGRSIAPPGHVEEKTGELKFMGFPPPLGYAHLGDDGVIRRFGKAIGRKEDLTDGWLEEVSRN